MWPRAVATTSTSSPTRAPRPSHSSARPLTRTPCTARTSPRKTIRTTKDQVAALLAEAERSGGNAVNYAVAGQGVPGLTVGQWKQTQAPRMDRDVVDLVENRKIPVYLIEEDLAERGIATGDLVPGVTLIAERALPKLVAEHEVV